MSIAAAKAEARERAFARRKAAHATHAGAAASALRAHLAGTEGRVIAGYLPIRTEADPLPAMTALCERNRIAVPVVVARGAPLAFREWRPGTPLERGTFGVMVPVAGADLVPDLIIAPLLAFDGRLFRLGYGGGFYDRTLEQLRARGPVDVLGFAYEAQRDDALPLEPTDQPLDALVTERGMFPRRP
ncbi:5-formyltetrahydrofolate cyclo-ligase [Tropicimonas sp. IMCC6043]|uniref:5-formyltetrahydrofolate cyclo-ligase n=1 Tax=Tropicimonas sp. IMCC6043 TaxID=2510645 RepID=UPI00101C8F74|nr:5-formyltetrahydrofolate cyclo-ligase [Tropicimonas sp. IMCC6043]RYH11841.1 5-formyltetrahydrofolate cyclo-ligase [Tropicimonas sp. IMCC6043]